MVLTEELQLEELVHRSVWSDETEMLAKILSLLRYHVYKKHRKWQELLPERYLNSANITVIPPAEVFKKQQQKLGRYFDGLAAAWKKEIDERQQQDQSGAGT